MRRIYSLLLSFSLLAGTGIAANARPATNAEIKLLSDSTQAYATALQTANFDAVLNEIPPRILEKLAEQSKVSKDQFRQIMVDQMKQLAATYKVDKITISQSRKRSGEFNDGTPYFVIPSEFIITANNQDKKRVKGELVAILDNNQWYFVRGDDATTLSTMTELFPGFEKIKLSMPEVSNVN